MPSRNTLTQSESFPNWSFNVLSDILDQNLGLLDGVSTSTSPGSVGNSGVSSSSSTLRTLFVDAEGNTWSRSARRSRRRIDSSPASSTRQPTLSCSVRVIETSDQGQSLVLEIQWLYCYGTDRTLFESFESHLWRKVGDELQNRKH